MTKDSFNKKNIDSATYAFMRELLEEILQEDSVMAENLRDWIKKKWVRITSSGEIGGPCGTSKKQSNPDRCLPQAKANSMTQSQRAATARKKKEGGKKGKQFVSNTKKAKVTREVKEQWPQELESRYGEFIFKLIKIGSDRAKYSLIDVETGEEKGTPVFQSVDSLKAFASDYIKPQGGTQSTNLGESKNTKAAGKKGAQVITNTKKGKVTTEQLEQLVREVLAEKKKKPGKATATHRADGKPKDACHKKVDGIYGMKTSAYKSMAISQCRNVGVANYSSKKKKK